MSCADAFPVCEADVIPVVAGSSNNITCRLNYTRFTDLSPVAKVTSSVTWPYGESGHFRSEVGEPHRSGRLTASVVDAPVTRQGLEPINWTAQFTFSVQSTNKDYATNNDTWSWTSAVIPVSSKSHARLLASRPLARHRISWHSTTPTRTPTPTSSRESSRECRRVVQLATGMTSGSRACRTCRR